MDHALDVAFSTVDSKNILHTAAKKSVVRNAPDNIREAFQRTFEKTAGVQADANAPGGERYYSTETVARVLGLSVEETEAKALAWLGPDALAPRDDISMVQ